MYSIRIACFLLLYLTDAYVLAQRSEKEILLFSYFKGNGEDGLHLAYSIDGYSWQSLKGDSSLLKPTAGHDKLMRDPCIIRGADGNFHMVWTASWNERGIGYAHSKDLLHWSEQKYITVMGDEPSARNCWAPEIFYDSQKKLYMIYWATTITGKFPETQSSKENAYNHRIYYVTTPDFNTFTKPELLYDHGFNVIDATIVHYQNQYRMILKDETLEPPQKNIRVASSGELTKGYGKPGDPITGKYWAEGPTALYRDNRWIVYFDKYRDKKMGAVESADFETWTDISDKITFPVGVRHGTVFQVSEQEFDTIVKGISKVH
jgi:hypothetical protein